MVMVCRKAACVDPRYQKRAAASGVQAPIRPEFEEDAREASGLNSEARNHLRAVPSRQTGQETEGR